MNIKPLGDRVVIERQEHEQSSAGGIVLTGSMITKSNRGIVIAVGNGTVTPSGVNIPMTVKVGDVVMFTEGYACKSESIDGKELLVMHEVDIMGIID